ncbi:cobalamin-binding protein [Candidatus Acetothermia bacterium]|jgi:iron complex transport system substrate-binding protein|nr:cobalamin-binding protein [Candidatus Acetothermia bacterium]MCI2431315.1 cobalamin-binding protein [Candidatus Acetothermia bacterium]MCI2436969.1 cobalamin-binding protein [Candidatus Acetothermia bacterium]
MKIISLLPSATEIVYELGLGDQLVGVSHDCDWPPEALRKPKLSTASVHSEISSLEIDQIVRERLHNGLSVYHIDAEQLQQLAPDLILTQELCEVCAPSFDDVRAAVKLLHGHPQIVSLEPRTIEDIFENILTVSEATGRETTGQRVVTHLRKRVERIRARTEELAERPKVCCIEWLEPLMVGGHWVPQIVEYAGGEDWLGEVGQPSRYADWAEILNYNPDIIVLMPCGFSMERTLREINLLTELDSWQELLAVKENQIFVVEASAYFNRPGPRIVTGLEMMAEIIHPEIFRGLTPEGALIRL